MLIVLAFVLVLDFNATRLAWKNLHHFLIQSEVSNRDSSRMFSRASRRLHEFASSFACFNGFPVSFTDHSKHELFSTVNWNMPYQRPENWLIAMAMTSSTRLTTFLRRNPWNPIIENPNRHFPLTTGISESCYVNTIESLGCVYSLPWTWKSHLT